MRRFWKYHGLGNDFVLVDHRGRANFDPVVTRAVCARHTGIGADGILAWLDGEDGRPFMRVFNSDGSVADMCGNGLRCFVRWLVEDMGIDGKSMLVGSDAGPQRCIPVLKDGCVVAVSVELGAPRFAGPTRLEAAGREYEGTDLFLGNPHFVIERAPQPDEVRAFGPALSTHSYFARGTNVEWLHVEDRTTAHVVVYERGAGFTQACGTGGAGAAVVGVQRGLLAADADIQLTQPGGTMTYRIASDFSEVWMSGPAARVFQGESPLLED